MGELKVNVKSFLYFFKKKLKKNIDIYIRPLLRFAAMKSAIKTWRERNGLKQTELARRAGVSNQLLSFHEKNPELPWSYKKAVLIDTATGGAIRWVDLVNGRG